MSYVIGYDTCSSSINQKPYYKLDLYGLMHRLVCALERRAVRI